MGLKTIEAEPDEDIRIQGISIPFKQILPWIFAALFGGGSFAYNAFSTPSQINDRLARLEQGFQDMRGQMDRVEREVEAIK